MDVEEENDRLERELTSPSRARLTEYAIARERRPHTAPDRPDRRAVHLGVAELAGDSVALPTVQ
jgi:hypothetical protein